MAGPVVSVIWLLTASPAPGAPAPSPAAPAAPGIALERPAQAPARVRDPAAEELRKQLSDARTQATSLAEKGEYQKAAELIEAAVARAHPPGQGSPLAQFDLDQATSAAALLRRQAAWAKAAPTSYLAQRSLLASILGRGQLSVDPLEDTRVVDLLALLRKDDPHAAQLAPRPVQLKVSGGSGPDAAKARQAFHDAALLTLRKMGFEARDAAAPATLQVDVIETAYDDPKALAAKLGPTSGAFLGDSMALMTQDGVCRFRANARWLQGHETVIPGMVVSSGHPAWTGPSACLATTAQTAGRELGPELLRRWLEQNPGAR